MGELWMALRKRLNEKGYGSFASKHEIMAIIDEEIDEVHDAVRMHGDKKHQQLAKELLDVAVGAVFGLACIRAEKIDW
jgi:NTP pyrophosphatase (non-canonical NTP hydrolase)